MNDYLALISKYTQGEHEQTVPAFIIHSALVTKKALDIAQKYMQKNPDVRIDLRLLEEMGMLHDIGIFRTQTPPLFTRGQGPYITHFTHGADILESERLFRHAQAAKTHSDITKEEIVAQKLPLPAEDHVPTTPEEEIISLADKYYTKRFKELFYERSVEEIREYLAGYGQGAVTRFNELHAKYCE